MSKSLEDTQVETLRKLGLSLVQTRVYLSLAKLGTADIKSIAASAKVARQDTYRIIASLEEMGFIERNVARTTTFTAITPKDAIGRLLENKKMDLERTQRQVQKVFDNFHEKNNGNNGLFDAKFTITSEHKLLERTHNKASNLCKKSIDIIIPLSLSEKTFLQSSKYLRKIIKRGVKVRVIVHEPQKETTPTVSLFAEESFQLRYLPASSIRFGMHIFDQKELTLAVSMTKPSMSLWTNSPHVSLLAMSYFETLWEKAHSVQPAKSDLN